MFLSLVVKTYIQSDPILLVANDGPYLKCGYSCIIFIWYLVILICLWQYFTPWFYFVTAQEEFGVCGIFSYRKKQTQYIFIPRVKSCWFVILFLLFICVSFVCFVVSVYRMEILMFHQNLLFKNFTSTFFFVSISNGWGLLVAGEAQHCNTILWSHTIIYFYFNSNHFNLFTSKINT